MKQHLALLFMALLFLASPTMQARRLKLMTYNIHHAEGMDKRYDPLRIAQLIADEAPDVVALQEVDSATQRVGGHYVAADIAQPLGMQDVYGAAIPFQGGKYGVSLLSKKSHKEVKHPPTRTRGEAHSADCRLRRICSVLHTLVPHGRRPHPVHSAHKQSHQEVSQEAHLHHGGFQC